MILSLSFIKTLIFGVPVVVGGSTMLLLPTGLSAKIFGAATVGGTAEEKKTD